LNWTSSSLVPLGLGDADAPAVICIPGAGASVTGFLAFASAVGGRYPIYGLQPRGLDLMTEPDMSVEAASVYYLGVMRRENIVRPVHLIGHSHGGRVAFDMALRLKASDCPVRSLTLVDTTPPECEDDAWSVPAQADMFREFVDVFSRSFGVRLRVSDSHMDGARTLPFASVVHAELVRTGCLSSRTSPDPILGSLLTFMAARRHPYRIAKPYAGSVKLVLVGSDGELGDARRRAFLDSGWRRVAVDLDTWTATGDHFSILRSPNVDRLAVWWLQVTAHSGHAVTAE
jgi:thioesterase domain-containing protein